MGALELKNEILRLIIETNDTNTLVQVKAVLTAIINQENGDWLAALSESQRNSIEQGLADITNGKVVANEQVMASIRAKIENYQK